MHCAEQANCLAKLLGSRAQVCALKISRWRLTRCKNRHTKKKELNIWSFCTQECMKIVYFSGQKKNSQELLGTKYIFHLCRYILLLNLTSLLVHILQGKYLAFPREITVVLAGKAEIKTGSSLSAKGQDRHKLVSANSCQHPRLDLHLGLSQSRKIKLK